MIIFLNNNEQFMDGYWAAVCGGIVPVPLAVGITDEHRLKLLRVARKIGNALLYTDSKNLERLQALANESGESALFSTLKSRCFLVESITRPFPKPAGFIARSPTTWRSSSSPRVPPASPKA